MNTSEFLTSIKKLPDRVLGAGANGTVYAGISLENGKTFAVKEIILVDERNEQQQEEGNSGKKSSSSSAFEVTCSKIRNEVEIATRIPIHDNIVTTYGVRVGVVASNMQGFFGHQSQQQQENANEMNQSQHQHYHPFFNNNSSTSSSLSLSVRSMSHVSSSSTSLTSPQNTNNKVVVASSATNNAEQQQQQIPRCIDIVMEYCEAGSLSSLIHSLSFASSSSQNENFPASSSSFLPEKLIRKFTIQILEGINHLHNVAKIVHRDVNSNNILIDKNGNVKITDYGTAKNRFVLKKEKEKRKEGGESSTSLLEESTTSSSSAATAATATTTAQFDTVVGTANFVAPEVCSGERYSSPSDIWSLGCVVFHMIVGTPPLYDIEERHANAFAIMYKLSSDENLVPEFPEKILVDSNLAVAVDFVKTCCRRNPKDRPTVQELQKHPWCQQNNNSNNINNNKYENSSSITTATTSTTGSSGYDADSDLTLSATHTLRPDNNRSSNNTSTTAAANTGRESNLSVNSSEQEGITLPSGEFVFLS